MFEKCLTLFIALCSLLSIASFLSMGNSAPTGTIYHFDVTDMEGAVIPLSTFRKSKVWIIVNVASECGYTKQNYEQLMGLYHKYNAQGLEILAFPCNQFGAQEPGTHRQIYEFLKQTYSVKFPVFAKMEVNGEKTSELFKYLKEALPGFGTNDIKWNFTKFLVVDGIPVKRYGTATSPLEIEPDVKKALAGAWWNDNINQLASDEL